MAARRKQAGGRVSKPDRPDRLRRFRATIWLEVAGLAAISAAVYLIHAGSLTYYRDDWYYMYDGLVGGGRVFVEMFRHLRPARGVLFEFLFGLFGTNPFPYHVLMYMLRLAGGLSALWLFRLLWPAQRAAAFFMALLFLIFPGFLWWVQGFEYLPMVLSVGLETASIACTLQAMRSEPRGARLPWLAAALISGWAYLALVEYAIGMEVLRWLCVYLVARRVAPDLRAALRATWRAAAVTVLVPAGFLLWRLLVFENARQATDLALQAGAALSSVIGLVRWAISLLQSGLNAAILAWVLPFSQYFFSLRLRDMASALAVAIVVLVITWSMYRSFQKTASAPADAGTWQIEAILAGLIGIVFGVLPVVIGNRTVMLDRFSHYALPASLAVALFVGGLVHLVADRRVQLAMLASLVSLAALTHAAVALQARAEQAQIRTFWHQMAWRIPDFAPESLLIVNFPFGYADDVDIVYGPANFIYRPEAQPDLPVRLYVNAVAIQPDILRNIRVGRLDVEKTYFDAHIYRFNYKRVMVISWPSENSCVRVLDGESPWFSISDPEWVIVAAGHSRLDQIMPAETPHEPPMFLFGEEPEQGWCYYFEKAELARQQSDWRQVAALGTSAMQAGLSPNDPIEWMPFLQAYMVMGEQETLRQLSKIVNTEPYYKQQACAVLGAEVDLTTPVSSDMRDFARGLFCN